ncbi:hypothetical protein AB2B41_22215 [Marimonas sp. MJW-29]|uniref:Uncharacterized protein n=1 Tax=Sulfitobacter sediminis TaxID=3234186 RepID=A0ABV3RUU2_9RHOB
MKKRVLLAASVGLFASSVLASDLDVRILRGSVQLGGSFTVAIKSENPLPQGARCILELPEPFALHVQQASETCAALEITQHYRPILDANGYAIPSEQVPAVIRVLGPEGDELGTVETMFPYNNQFSELRIVIKGVRNPVSVGQTFEAVVQGAGQPIDPSLMCRWNTYGPVNFEPTSDNACIGKLTVLAPTGRDADMDVEIVNLTDMHAVGYAIASMIVE